jgi:hypothetical protein
MKEVNVFNYVDARAYLRDCQKAEIHPMTESYRAIAKRVGVGGPYLWLIMHGKKPFSKKTIDNMPGILPINDKQMKYLKLLMYLANIDMDKDLRIDVINKFRPAAYHKMAKK